MYLNMFCLKKQQNFAQSEMQLGFAKGLSPAMAGLLISEAKADSQENKTHIYVPALDSQKAFDIVHHANLLDKLVHIVIFLQDGLSDSFPINQGVGQGRILSTGFYKVYIDELLRVLKSKRLDFHIGTVYIGYPTCADNIALLALLPDELQLMLYEALNYSKKNRYQIHLTFEHFQKQT